MTSIDLKYNSGIKWFKYKNIYAKGFLFDCNGNFLDDESVPRYFDGIKNKTDFYQKLQEANGFFSVIIKSNNFLFSAVDRTRMFPLFYSQINNELFISDDAETIKKKCNLPEINTDCIPEFLASGYVAGKNTLLKNIYQIQAGEMITFNTHNLTTNFYSRYSAYSVSDQNYDELKNEFRLILDHLSKRFVESLNNRTVVLSLSGGYDSRLIAVMLKKMNYKNVICYCHGRKGNQEEALSRQSAYKLGFKWYFIEYNTRLIGNYLQDEDFRNYYKYSANYTSMFFLEQFFALKFLKHNKLIPEKSIFLAGHSGDFLGGSQLYKNGNIKEKASIKKIVDRIYFIKYALLRLSKNNKIEIKKRIKDSLTNEYDASKLPLAYTIFEDWDFKEKLAKFIFNSVNVYTFFGYEYRLPLWDNEMIDFFKILPYDFKLNKLLYNDVLKNDFFEPYYLNFSKELQSSYFNHFLQKQKNKLKPYLPHKIKTNLLIKNDTNNYHEITNIMINDLIKNGVKVDLSGRNYNSIIVQWYINSIKSGDL
jgi:asparagine synthase (glutamine-hydrolysing)